MDTRKEDTDFIKEQKASLRPNLDISIDYNLNNPYQVTLPGGFYSSQSLKGLEEKPSFLDTVKAQTYRMNATLRGIHGLGSYIDETDPLFDVKPDGWTSKTDISKYENVRPEFRGAMLNARSPKHQDYLYQKILEEQKLDDDAANGSWLSWLIGGGLGIVSDPMTYIPIVGWSKYANVSSSFLMSAARSLPGGASYAVLSSVAEQMDKVNGNVHDFLVDSFVKTVFSTVLFGALGAGASLTEKMALWELKDLAKATIEGVDFKFKVNEKGEINGYQLVDTTGGLSAEKVSYYEDMAKSQFNKSGVFKIPYVGEGIIKLAGMPVFGSPLINLINSKSQVVRAFIDRIADHNFITKGVAEGEVAPRKFASLMNQEYAKLRALSVQYDALFYERNGIETSNRVGASAIEKALYLKNKGAELLGKQGGENYVSREKFNDEVQHVIYSGERSEHSSVNEAAALHKEQMDTTYKAYRKAYNLPEDWLPPKTAQEYLTRVYDTPFMNSNRGAWKSTISNWLKDADNIITEHLQPIKNITEQIEANKANQESFLKHTNITDAEKKAFSEELEALKLKKKVLEEQLQNELRNNPDLQLHVEDWNALSADEAHELEQLTKRRDIAKKEISEQKKVIAKIKSQAEKRSAAALKNKTVQTAKSNKRKSETGKLVLEKEEAKLSELEKELDQEEQKLQELAASGKINYRFARKQEGSSRYVFRNPNERLKFRDPYESHFHREQHAEAYYNTIMNQTPEDTINQVMGRFTGNASENPLKSRTLLIPDKVLYDGKFLTNDVMAKVSNYTSYLARRTHLKTVFNDVSIDGGIEPILNELNVEFEKAHIDLSNRKTELQNKLLNKDLETKEKAQLEKNLKKVNKELAKLRTEFDKNKDILRHIYEKMMGIQKTSRRAQQIKSAVMSITAWANLPFVPLTQINDLSAIGLQHGIWPLIRDGMYPLVESLGGILKTKDSEALRNAAPSVHLALQDVGMGYADRNWSMQTNPYLNLGRWVNTLEKIAHLSSNFTMTNYIDNLLQRITGSVVQSELMRILHASQLGKLSKRDSNYILKYGIDPKVWQDRMLAAYKKNGGGKTKLGGYQSHFWQWEDQEASNVFADAVFRSIKDTQIQAGLIDAPLFTDDNGPIGIMGSFLRGFNGWAFASVNRYVIPSLQQPDAEKLMGVLGMLATGFWVDPFRRVARGEEMFPDSLKPKEIMWSTFTNSGYFSWFANILADANLMTGDTLLGNLRSDKYKDRTRAGLLGPAWGTVNRMADIISAAGSGEWNEADMKKAARMLPFVNASWTWWMSKYIIESLELPRNRAAARGRTE